jgi:hypothetical protein
MLNFGVRRGWFDGNPAALIEKQGREQSRDRVLADDEIRDDAENPWAVVCP